MANVTHDLKNPIMGVLGYITLMESLLPNDDYLDK